MNEEQRQTYLRMPLGDLEALVDRRSGGYYSVYGRAPAFVYSLFFGAMSLVLGLPMLFMVPLLGVPFMALSFVCIIICNLNMRREAAIKELGR